MGTLTRVWPLLSPCILCAALSHVSQTRAALRSLRSFEPRITDRHYQTPKNNQEYVGWAQKQGKAASKALEEAEAASTAAFKADVAARHYWSERFSAFSAIARQAVAAQSERKRTKYEASSNFGRDKSYSIFHVADTNMPYTYAQQHITDDYLSTSTYSVFNRKGRLDPPGIT